MTEHLSYQELILFINEIKQKNSNLYTNYYYNEEYYLNMEDVYVIKYDYTIILLHNRHSFRYIYFWSNSLSELSNILNNLKDNNTEPFIIEVIYKGSNKLEKYLLDIQYQYYGGIQRLQKKVDNSDILFEHKFHISYADKADIDAILKLHTKLFNIYIDRELTYKELLLLINNQNVLLCKINGRIAGCLIYNKRGKFYHLRYWFVDKELSVKGIGKALLYKLYNITGEGNFIEVWSRKDNQLVTDIYKRYGFKKDGLQSDIFIYSLNFALIEPLIPLN